MKNTTYRWLLGCAFTTVALLASRDVAHAAVTPYSNLASWTAAAGSSVLVEDFADSSLVPGLAIIFGKNIPAGSISGGTYNDVGVTQNNDAGNPKLDFGGGTFVFGADWDFAPGGAGDGLVIVLKFVDATSTFLFLGNPAGAAFNGFFGFVSDVAVSSIRLDSPDVESFSMDNARFRFPVGKINFDDATNGAVINTRYAGVTFTNPIGGNIFARHGSGFAPSPPNVVSVFGTGVPAFDARFGAVDGRFATPVGTVSIDARPQAPVEFLTALTRRPFLQAFDAGGALLGTVYYAGALPTGGGAIGPTETLTFTSTANNIAVVRFSSQNPGSPPTVPPTYGLFDNLCFSSLYTLSANATGGGSVSASPSQASYAAGTVVTLTATPLPNWIFSGWSGDASGTANPLPLTMNGNKTVTATFVPVPTTTSTPEASFCADFNSGVPPGLTLFGQAAVNGGFLKLTTALEGQFGIAYVNDFNGGQNVSAFRATFKAALFGSTCCGAGAFPADGFSFNLVPAASVRANPGLGEPAEEGLTNGLAVTFDTWDNGGGEAPAIEVKWLGQIIATAPFQASQSPAGLTDPVAASREVVINLESDGTIDVSYGGVAVLNNVPTPYQPWTIGAPKWVIGARTGGANDNHWLDDLCIQTLAGAKLCRDFDSGVPAGTTLFGGASVNAGRLKLYTVAQADGFGIAYLDDFSGGQFVQAFRATFQAALFGSTCCGGGALPADGFSFNLVPATSVLSNPGYNQPGEEGLGEGLSVNFDTWDNGDGEVAPAIEVKWLGQVIAAVPFQSSQSPAGITDPAAASRAVVIELKANGRLDVSYGGTLVLNNVATPYDPAAIRTPKWVLGARVGGANDNFWFDDLCIATLPAPGHQIPGLFNTGVNSLGLPLSDNAIDPHYRLTFGGTDAFAATEAGGFPIPPWLGSNSMSAWIAPALDTQGPSDGSGTFNYRYETTFNLTAFNPATARLAGRWATDNQGVDILINGVSTAQANTNQFGTWTSFQITTGFVAGTNRLTFVVNNGSPGSPAGVDPTGLRAEIWGAASLAGGFQPAAPPLNMRQQNGILVFAWPQPGFVLQSAPNVTGPWRDLTRGSSVNGLDYTAILSPSGPARFFRLRLEGP